MDSILLIYTCISILLLSQFSASPITTEQFPLPLIHSTLAMDPTLDNLPTELLHRITSFLPPEYLASKACLILCCKTILYKFGTAHWKRISNVQPPSKEHCNYHNGRYRSKFYSTYYCALKSANSLLVQQAAREEFYRFLDQDQLGLFCCASCKIVLGTQGSQFLQQYSCTLPGCRDVCHCCYYPDTNLHTVVSYVQARRLITYYLSGWDYAELSSELLDSLYAKTRATWREYTSCASRFNRLYPEKEVTWTRSATARVVSGRLMLRIEHKTTRLDHRPLPAFQHLIDGDYLPICQHLPRDSWYSSFTRTRNHAIIKRGFDHPQISEQLCSCSTCSEVVRCPACATE